MSAISERYLSEAERRMEARNEKAGIGKTGPEVNMTNGKMFTGPTIKAIV